MHAFVLAAGSNSEGIAVFDRTVGIMSFSQARVGVQSDKYQQASECTSLCHVEHFTV